MNLITDKNNRAAPHLAAITRIAVCIGVYPTDCKFKRQLADRASEVKGLQTLQAYEAYITDMLADFCVDEYKFSVDGWFTMSDEDLKQVMRNVLLNCASVYYTEQWRLDYLQSLDDRNRLKEGALI